MKKCKDLMNVELKMIAKAATALEASQTMRDNSIGFLPVCDPTTGRLVGVITDRDLVTRMCASDTRPSEVRVADVATAVPAVCHADDHITQAETLMMSSDISRLVVVDEDAHPIGVLSLTDLIMDGRRGRAIRKAQGVLGRGAAGPHVPVESIELTPSGPDAAPSTSPEPSAQETYESSETAQSRDDYIAGGRERRAYKEFPG